MRWPDKKARVCRSEPKNIGGLRSRNFLGERAGSIRRQTNRAFGGRFFSENRVHASLEKKNIIEIFQRLVVEKKQGLLLLNCY